MRIVTDTSVIIAVIAGEPEKARLERDEELLEDAVNVLKVG